jgi:hypothetical protein
VGLDLGRGRDGIVEVFIPGFFFPRLLGRGRLTGLVLLAADRSRHGCLRSVALHAPVLRRRFADLVARPAPVAGVRKGQLKIWDRDINED